MKLTATMQGFDKLTLKVKYLQRAAAFGLKAGVEEAALLFETTAKELVPVLTGDLQNSIQTNVVKDSEEVQQRAVVATSEHAMFIEYGTGIVGAANPHPPLPSSGVPITGGWIYDYKNQNWIGMAAQPYMRPAYETHRIEAEKRIKESVRGELINASNAAAARRNR